MPYTVTRQRQWPDGTPVVEVSAGGLDYTNPDALVAKYPGEFETFDDPEEAAEAAIAICEAWRRDGAPDAQVAYGATLGMTMPFAPCTYEELRAWAKQRRERLPQCDRCGSLLPGEHYRNHDTDEHFCSEYCAEAALKDYAEPDPEGGE